MSDKKDPVEEFIKKRNEEAAQRTNPLQEQKGNAIRPAALVEHEIREREGK